MSRCYECQAEVFPCTQEERGAIAAVLERWGLEVECDTESFDNEDHDGWSFWGSIQLTNGATEEAKHEELRALLPDRFVTSRWMWVPEDTPWDETFISEPLKPAKK